MLRCGVIIKLTQLSLVEAGAELGNETINNSHYVWSLTHALHLEQKYLWLTYLNTSSSKGAQITFDMTAGLGTVGGVYLKQKLCYSNLSKNSDAILYFDVIQHIC